MAEHQSPMGFINLNKPSGFTSHDCVAKIRKLLKMKRIGHGGTLDPTVTGVLPIAVGRATRLLQFLPQNKVYRGKIRFGVQTTTDDLAGETIHQQSADSVEIDHIKPLLQKFIGQIEQIPPAYSAIQQEGKRLYELARKGEKIEVPARTVTVNQIEILGWFPGEFPELEVEIACGSGTYIRAIARDLGNCLGVGGTLAQLTRTQSCGFTLAESITFGELSDQVENDTVQLLAPDQGLSHLPKIILEPESAKRWCQGQRLPWQQEGAAERFTSPLRVYHQDGKFLGIGEQRQGEAQKLIIPKIVLESSVAESSYETRNIQEVTSEL